MWGHRFTNIVEYDRKNEVYVADYDQFDSTESVNVKNFGGAQTKFALKKN